MELATATIQQFITELGSRTTTPGGGAAAAISAAQSAALARMVVVFSKGKKAFTEHEQVHAEMEAHLLGLADDSIRAGQEDAEAWGRLSDVLAMRPDDPARAAALEPAVMDSIEAPRRIQEISITILEHCEYLLDCSSKHLKSDLAIAADLASVAARSAAWNVNVNTPLLQDRQQAQHQQDASDDTCRQASSINDRIRNRLLQGQEQ